MIKGKKATDTVAPSLIVRVIIAVTIFIIIYLILKYILASALH